ncbi:hypothetical protein ACIO3O_42030 [Streptomyces sp. NPDC087440]|uniref:hypothetical protein n=1 Tax=Streptomyces sp. NPDC087440 TaxID=3365790 RepID=UPI0037F68E35
MSRGLGRVQREILDDLGKAVAEHPAGRTWVRLQDLAKATHITPDGEIYTDRARYESTRRAVSRLREQRYVQTGLINGATVVRPRGASPPLRLTDQEQQDFTQRLKNLAELTNVEFREMGVRARITVTEVFTEHLLVGLNGRPISKLSYDPQSEEPDDPDQ